MFLKPVTMILSSLIQLSDKPCKVVIPMALKFTANKSVTILLSATISASAPKASTVTTVAITFQHTLD